MYKYYSTGDVQHQATVWLVEIFPSKLIRAGPAERYVLICNQIHSYVHNQLLLVNLYLE